MEEMDPETFFTTVPLLSAYTGAFQAQLMREEREANGEAPAAKTQTGTTKTVPSDTASLRSDPELSGLIDFG